LVLDAAVVVFGPGDIILTKIIPCLDLDKDEWASAPILDAVPGSFRDINGLAGREMNLFVVPRDCSLPLEYEPVLPSLSVLLERESLPAVYDDPLYFVVRSILKYMEAAPGATVFFVHWLYSRRKKAACQSRFPYFFVAIAACL
jgi:hypothetical protein